MTHRWICDGGGAPNISKSMRRRDFLSLCGLAAGSFLVPDAVARVIRETCVLAREPHLVLPRNPTSTLYALSSNMKTEFMLHLGNPFEEEKLPTWREYFDEHESIDIDDKEAVEEWWRGIAHLFHAGIEDDKKTRALKKAFDLGGDIFDLLVRYGADHTVFSVEEVTESRRKELIEWYLHRGMDWEQGYPIAHALARGQREFLGFCLGLRDKVPSARMQAAMALRKHCSEGRMRWVA